MSGRLPRPGRRLRPPLLLDPDSADRPAPDRSFLTSPPGSTSSPRSWSDKAQDARSGPYGRQPRTPQPARGRPPRSFDMLSPIRRGARGPGPTRPTTRPWDAGLLALGRRPRTKPTTTTAPPTPPGLRRPARRAPCRLKFMLASGHPGGRLLESPTGSSPRSTPRCAPATRSRSSRGRSPPATGPRRSAPRWPVGPGSPPRGDARHLRGPLVAGSSRPARLVRAPSRGAAGQDRVHPGRMHLDAGDLRRAPRLEAQRTHRPGP